MITIVKKTKQYGIIRAYKKPNFTWASFWADLVSATIEDANPDQVILTFTTAKTELTATDFSVTVNGEARAISTSEWTEAVLTLTLESDCLSEDVVVITFGKTGGTADVINNISWSSYWVTRSKYCSDGTIVDGKLLNLKGDQNTSPTLVESNCLQMAVDDVISFADLSGWSIISHLGTATLVIDGNDVKCTNAGTLYNLILSDGANQHTYPLAEGGYVIAHDTYPTPVNGNINCSDLTWGTQDNYHKNVEGHNFRDSFDVYNEANFKTAGSGIPVGWENIYGPITSTVTDGVVRLEIQMRESPHILIIRYSEIIPS